MSFFPSPNPEGDSSPVSLRQTFLQTPFTPTPGQAQQDQWAGMNNASEQSSSTMRDTSWSREEPRGLGLHGLPTTATQLYSTASIAPQQMTQFTPFAWPSEFAIYQPPSIPLPPPRRDSWSDSCDPLSTLLPGAYSGRMQRVNSSAVAYNTSPGRSDYSASSHQSAVSTPYARSDGVAQPRGSPLIKVEHLHDRTIPRTHLVPEISPFEQSLLVNPGDLVTQPQLSIEERVKSILAPSSHSDAGDFKPPIARPDNRRAFSSEDVREDVFEDRRKRGYTKPENANCCCEQCGKLFQRHYNLQAHMETHNPHRTQPNPCQYPGCEQRFRRRTDLARHESSVSAYSRLYARTCLMLSRYI